MEEIYNMEDKKLKESELEKVSGGDSGGAKIEPIESERPSIPGPANLFSRRAAKYALFAAAIM